ncbi:hypothetical protein [Tenacibaculum ovolyticum]|uniref:hypothetical protein n=1 Tax=Tenacibaculum ovolyticum TaxID=104270 RepID=UPI003BACB64C
MKNEHGDWTWSSDDISVNGDNDIGYVSTELELKNFGKAGIKMNGIKLWGTGGGTAEFGRKKLEREEIITTYDMKGWTLPGAGGKNYSFVLGRKNIIAHT